MPHVRQPAQKSMKVAAREAMKGDAVPNDFGLLPGKRQPWAPTPFFLTTRRNVHHARPRQDAGNLQGSSTEDEAGMAPLQDPRGGFRGVSESTKAWPKPNPLLIPSFHVRVIYYKWGIATKPNPRPKLALGNTGRLAQALYTQMYTALAEFVPHRTPTS